MRNRAVLVVIVLWSIGCGSPSRFCVPGMQVACSCPGGSSGVQVCNTGGTAYGDCTGCPAAPGGGDMGAASPITYSTTGTYQYAVPTGVASIVVKVWGAGGGGREGGLSFPGGPGGGGGGYAQLALTVTPGAAFKAVVGKGGAGGNANTGDGSPGADSSFIDASTQTALVTATGGKPGTAASGGGAGGTGSTNGVTGGAGANPASGVGGMGGAGANGGAGGIAEQPGTAPGGGGGGGTTTNGASGADGQVSIVPQ